MESGFVAFIQAVLDGRASEVERIAEQHESLVNKPIPPHEWTALHIAAWKGDVDVIRALALYDADANAMTGAGHTPLHISAARGDVESLSQLVMSGASVNHPDRNERTPLCLATHKKHMAAANSLISYGADMHKVTLQDMANKEVVFPEIDEDELVQGAAEVDPEASSAPALAETESKLDARKAFAIFDNGDRTLAVDDLGEALRVAGLNPTVAQVQDAAKGFAGQTTMSFEEFELVATENYVDAGEEDRRLREALALLDSEGRGYFTEEQLRGILQDCGEGLGTADIEDIVATCKHDDSGNVTVQELVAMLCS